MENYVLGEMRLSVLGPVRAWRGDAELDLGSPQQRALLGLLILREGEAVTIDEVVDALWGNAPPRAARGTVRTYVYRLRRILRGTGDEDAVPGSAGNGYVLPAGAARTDLRVFCHRVEQARALRSDGNLSAAAELLRNALLLWRGTAMAGVPGDYVEQQRAWLEELRLGALEDRFAVDLDLGRHAEAIAELTAMVAAHPLRERLRESLMLALYRSGRQADALASYQEIRALLVDELGIDPGPALQTLHERILRSDPELVRPAMALRPDLAHMRKPAQLPRDLPNFVGRSAEIAEMTGALTQAARSPVIALTGLGGMGKTALAVHVAHVVRDRFPGGLVYADLAAASGQPADPFSVLGGFLRAFGVPETSLPDTLSERAALWRTVLAGHSVLIVLDDAHDSAQVRDLLPAAPGSAAIITCWQRMIDLVGVQWIKLGGLTPEDALELLGAVASRQRVLAERQSSARLVAACSHQPLAVRVAAARLLARPLWTVRQLEKQLNDDLRDPIIMQEDCEVVEAPFLLAESRLSAELGSVFRVAAVPDCAQLCAATVAALLDMPQARAWAVLESLVDAHLLEPLPSGTYRYPGLVKAFARRRALAADGEASCRTALRRLLMFYLATARNAADLIEDVASPAPDVVSVLPGGLSFPGARSARAWLAGNGDDVLALLNQVGEPADRGWLATLLSVADRSRNPAPI